MLQIRLWPVIVMLCVALTSCGGGGGSSSSAPVSNPPPPAVPTAAELNAAARAASQATFGLVYDDIHAMAETGFDAWLDGQFALAPTLHTPVVDSLFVQLNNGDLPDVDDDLEHIVQFRRYAWWNRTMTAPDLLRQRVAFALSEIFVVSDRVDVLVVYPHALSTYYDALLTHAFGNFRDLLEAIALHPSMGVYLSHVNNAKADPANNTFPDENFAREVMQLFSIGLFELEADGTERVDTNGQPIPTYDNDDIREMAKIFTGLSYPGQGAFFGNPQPDFTGPMQMFDAFHEPGDKQLLNGLVVPGGQTGEQDIRDALDNLFNHANVGPFIGKLLIQRLVTSNPSPAYVARVTAAFNGDNTGVRGDMQAVIRAILTDPEAAVAPDSTLGGRLKEPLVRYIAMIRQLNAQAEDGLFYDNGYLQQFLLDQHPLSSPSVFNFFLPSHSPAGELADAGLVAPEFQITDATTVVGITNLVEVVLLGEIVMGVPDHFGQVSLDLSEFETLAVEGNDALLDRLDLLFTHGELSTATRNAISAVMDDIDDVDFRVKFALYMLLTSPDFAVRV